MRVCIAPFYSGEDKADGGIRRVVEALVRHLPDYGWHATNNPDEADLIACHGATLIERPGVPMVCHNHGLMWEDYFLHYGDDVNKHVIDAMVRAQAITAPSRWVAQAISRGMLVSPTVIYHGVDTDEWTPPAEPLDYIIWNKARIDPVSDPNDIQTLAELLPDVRFLTTYGKPTANVLPIGVGNYTQMRPVVQQAALYLATTRETFGIGTLEALAAGVPVVGWDYGGQHEIITQGETGILVPFGDFDALASAARRLLADRARFSAAARADAVARWQWGDKIAQYAALYTRTLEAYRAPRPKVSVIVTSYNLEHFLGEALTSVAEQTMTDWECVIVDDCSTDETAALAKLWTEDQKTPKHDGRSFTTKADPRFRYVRTPQNLGLSGARNYGFSQSRGRSVLFLDADDLLAPNALDILSTALDRDSGLHIAYGSLDTMAHDGAQRKRNPWPAGAFSWHAQIAHLNQLHGASLMRREVLERSGGYRKRDWRAEDAAFWSRVTSLGFRAAKVTEETIQIYRMHDSQKSRTETGDGDWTAWLPWRLAGNPHEGMAAMREKTQPNARLVPFGAQGTPPLPMRAWPVRHHQHPTVSIIIPVGPGHTETLVDALDSVQAQTMPEWECIVVDDSIRGGIGDIITLKAHPWAHLVTTGGVGAGAARNRGLAEARAPFTVFLDADDVLHPRFLEETLKAYDGRYVYTDWATLHEPDRIDGEVETHTVEEYDQQKMLAGLRHAVTALVPTRWLRDVAGFDEGLPCFEDWDLYCKLAITGYCGRRLAKPLLIYRHQHGKRTRTALKPRQAGQSAPAYTDLGEHVAGAVRDRYSAYITGEETVMGCCGNSPTIESAASAALNDMVAFATGGIAEHATLIPEGTTVRMEFIGEQQGAQTFYGKGTGQQYRAGREPISRFHDVQIPDVEHFVNLGLFRVVEAAPLMQSAIVEDGQVTAVEPRVERPKPKGRRVNA
jgi:glycosyltransferase involved in cell wall biosynthesis